MFLTNIIAYAIIIGRFKMVAEKYPRGRRGSPAKGVVREKRSQGSNPCFSAKSNSFELFTFRRVFFYFF